MIEGLINLTTENTEDTEDTERENKGVKKEINHREHGGT